MKNIIVLFCVIVQSCEIFGEFKFVRNFLENTDANLTVVRTPAERDSRWKEFAVLDFVGLVQQHYGYTAEEYDVQTTDGYILKMHRISGSPVSPKAYGKPVILLGHGLFSSSDMFVVSGPQHALAFLLADVGYDVWFGNHRGNSYSKRHIQYSTSWDNYDFWNFSMDEMGLYDMPVFVDTVLEKTNQKKLTYIGYSLGSTVSYIFLSARPEYNEKINLVFDIAPVAIFTRPLRQLLSLFTVLEPLVKSFAVSKRLFCILPQSKFFQIVGKDICGSKQGLPLCETFLKFIARIDKVNSTLYSTIFGHLPAGTSLNTVDHYYQFMKSGKFRFYDYGVSTNKVKYNAISPPEYDLSKITSPQAMFYATHDVYANYRDTKALKNKLPNVVAFEKAPENFNHLDFGFHINARDAIYYRMLEIIARYS